MTTPDYKALCAELAKQLERLHKQSVTSPHTQVIKLSNGLHPLPLGNDLLLQDHLTSDLLARARAALAEEEVGPSDEQIDEVFEEFGEYFSDDDCKSMWWSQFREAARCLLARYGSAPALEVERLPDGAQIIEPTERTVLVPAPRPIPVGERLPGAEDCDAQGRCWFSPWHQQGYAPNWRLIEPYLRHFSDAWWLPAHALPLPAQEVTK